MIIKKKLPENYQRAKSKSITWLEIESLTVLQPKQLA